jgi:hypothetical protein
VRTWTYGARSRYKPFIPSYSCMRNALAALCLAFCAVLTIADLGGAVVALVAMRAGPIAYQAGYVAGVVLGTFSLGAVIFFMARWASRTLRPSK